MDMLALRRHARRRHRAATRARSAGPYGERSYHEIDRTLGFPLRHSGGFMLGAKVLGLYGPDTDEAFGHLGFTNVMAWADPRRELAVGLITSGKPYASTHLGRLFALTRAIGTEAPKVARTTLERV